MSVVRPEPRTAADWHSALAPHVGHELAVHSRREPMQTAVVQCVSQDGRVSLSFRPTASPPAEAAWLPHRSAPLFFAGRSVGCRTCQMPVAY